MPSAIFDNIASRATSDIQHALQEAYNAGRADMRQELMALLSPAKKQDDIVLHGAMPDIAIARTSAKAPRGTVKPAILNMIETSSGLLTEQIIAATGFKENSVRGTLSALSKEGKIERDAGHWIKKKAPVSELTEAS